MKKKNLAILLGFFMVMAIAGCSSSEPVSDETVETEAAVPGKEDAAEPEEEEIKQVEQEQEEKTDEEPEVGTEKENTDEKDEEPVKPEVSQIVDAFGLLQGKGQPDESAEAVIYYEFKKEYKDENNKVTGTAEFKIPQLAERSTVAGLINQDILKYFEEKYELAEDSVQFMTGEMANEDTYSLTTDYKLTYLSEDKICLLIQGSEYSGGAHGMPFKNALIYDLKEGNKIEPKELFDVTEEEFARLMTEAFEKQIADSPDDYWPDAMDYVREGAAFDKADFYLTEKGVRFYFEPYTLAAYAYGYIEAEVPYDSLPLR